MGGGMCHFSKFANLNVKRRLTVTAATTFIIMRKDDSEFPLIVGLFVLTFGTVFAN